MKKITSNDVKRIKLFFGIDFIDVAVRELSRNGSTALVNYHGLFCVMPLDKEGNLYKHQDSVADLGFWFTKYDVAVSFMRTYRGYHTVEFWCALFRKVYSFSFVCSCMSKIEREVIMMNVFSDVVISKK